MKELKPIDFNPKYEEAIRKKIRKFFHDIIFAPIYQTFKESNLQFQFENSSSILKDAILSGKIQYADGIVKGDFNAKITKEFEKLGYNYDSRIKGFRISLSNLPQDIISAITQATTQFNLLQSKLLNVFSNINYAQQLNELSFFDQYSLIQQDIDKQFKKTVIDAIGITPEFTETQKIKLAEEYSNNLKLYVKNFIDDEVIKLRGLVENNAFSGMRADRLQTIIKKQFDVSDRKAKFLAKQETSLITAKYRESRYLDAGINKYVWSSSGDSKVRSDHKRLNGKVFSFDNPPIVNLETGKRANPSEDFGCRCKAKPLVIVE